MSLTPPNTVRHRLVTSEAGNLAVHGLGAVGRFNRWAAVGITNAVGTMWCAYTFAAIALSSLPEVLRQHDTAMLVSWFAQTFLQLVLLSIIIVGQRVQQEAADARAAADHEILDAVHVINLQQSEILVRLDAAIARPMREVQPTEVNLSGKLADLVCGKFTKLP